MAINIIVLRVELQPQKKIRRPKPGKLEIQDSKDTERPKFWNQFKLFIKALVNKCSQTQLQRSRLQRIRGYNEHNVLIFGSQKASLMHKFSRL